MLLCKRKLTLDEDDPALSRAVSMVAALPQTTDKTTFAAN
jgi:hypothetical protein